MTLPSVSPKERQAGLYDAIQADSPGWQRRSFDEYFTLVRGLLIKALGPGTDVDDLVSDVFVGFFESARNIRSAEGLRSYIVSIAMNTARRELRSRKRRRLLFLWDSPDLAMERAPGTDDPRAKAALLQLADILNDLSAEERLVYLLHVVENLPVIDVAETLELSVSTVKRRLRRATERVLRRVARNPLLTDYVQEKSGVERD
jgi:RNA polymerase sigma-70 factor, ECF subfamily